MTYQYVTYLYHYGILRQTNRWLWERLLLTSSYHSPAPPSDNLAAATIPSLSRSLFCPRFTLFTYRIILLSVLIHVSSVFYFSQIFEELFTWSEV